MSFSYQFGSNPQIDYPRQLIGDTQQFAADGSTRAYVFEDSEIVAAYGIQQAMFQSSMFYSDAGGQNLPSGPVSYLRVAALLLDCIAANKSRLSSVGSLLDVKLNVDKTADALRKQAQEYRDIEDNAGAFVIIEQCSTQWSFLDRFWKQVQRQQGIGF